MPAKQVKLWQFYKFLTHYHELNAKHNPPVQLTDERDITAVLDGQQRLTALIIGLTGSYAARLKSKRRSNLSAYPINKLYIDLLNPADESDEQKFFAIEFRTPEEAAGDAKRFWVKPGLESRRRPQCPERGQTGPDVNDPKRTYLGCSCVEFHDLSKIWQEHRKRSNWREAAKLKCDYRDQCTRRHGCAPGAATLMEAEMIRT